MINTAFQNIDFSHRLIQSLFQSGLEHAVISPGSRNTPLILALEKCAKIKKYIIIDERSAAFFALGQARITQKATLLICTSGSAGAHYLPAIIEAKHSRIPLIILTADRPYELQDCGAPQTIPQTHFYVKQINKIFDIHVPLNTLEHNKFMRMFAEIWDKTQIPQQGPVHVNCSFREPLWDEKCDTIKTPLVHPVKIKRSKPVIDKNIIDEAIDFIGHLEEVILICGPIFNRSQASSSLAIIDLAKKLNCPILADPLSGLRFYDTQNNPCIYSYDAILRNKYIFDTYVPQKIIRLGAMPTSKILSEWLESKGLEKTILIDEKGDFLDSTHTATLQVVSDPYDFCSLLNERIPDSNIHSNWLKKWKTAENIALKTMDIDCDTWWEVNVLRCILKKLPPDALLHISNSMPIREIDTFAIPFDPSIQICANRGANGIDGTMSTALGEISLNKNLGVVILGDIAFLHDISALWMAKKTKLSLLIIVLNNRGGNIFRHLAISSYKGILDEYFLTPQEINLNLIANSVGASFMRVDNFVKLENSLDKFIHTHGLRIIEVVFDGEEDSKKYKHVLEKICFKLDLLRKDI